LSAEGREVGLPATTAAIQTCTLNVESGLLLLHVTDQPPLRPGVAVDVAFGRLDGAMPREQLHVTQTAARAMDVAGGEGDEAAPAGVRRGAKLAPASYLLSTGYRCERLNTTEEDRNER
jgi:hypothetical protein